MYMRVEDWGRGSLIAVPLQVRVEGWTDIRGIAAADLSLLGKSVV